MRKLVLLLSVLQGIVVSPVLAEPPDIEDTDYITGCLKNGKLLSFEISSWGAYRPCWKHGNDAEWITLPRANQNSQLFTVDVELNNSHLSHPGPTLFGDYLILIKEIGSFRIYSLGSNIGCGIAVGPAPSSGGLSFAKGGYLQGDLLEPYLINVHIEGPGGLIFLGDGDLLWRMANPNELFTDGDRGDVLIPRFILASEGHVCSLAITFEYLETPYAHTVYKHDPDTDEVTVEYRQEK